MERLKSIISILTIYISIAFTIIGTSFYFEIEDKVFRYLGFFFLCIVSDKISKWLYRNKNI